MPCEINTLRYGVSDSPSQKRSQTNNPIIHDSWVNYGAGFFSPSLNKTLAWNSARASNQVHKLFPRSFFTDFLVELHHLNTLSTRPFPRTPHRERGKARQVLKPGGKPWFPHISKLITKPWDQTLVRGLDFDLVVYFIWPRNNNVNPAQAGMGNSST